MSLRTLFLCLFAVLLALPVVADDKDKEPAADKVLTVAKKPFKIDVTLPGVIEAEGMTEVAIAPQTWAGLVVLDAVPHGTKVTKGQKLIQLETIKIDEAIRDLEAARALAELGIRQATEDIRLLTQSVPVDLELAERTKKIADEDLDQFVKIERPLAEKAAQFHLKMVVQNLEYQSEELKQLEKMYKADDLTEETEEIVLKRAKNDVDAAQFQVDRTKTENDLTLKVTLPRQLESHKNAARAATLALEKARATLPIALNKAKATLEKEQFDFHKADEQLARLKADRALLAIAAPADGIVYYGRSERGKWATAAEMHNKLRPGGAVQPREVLVTVVSPQKVFARVSVPEKELLNVAAGMEVQVKPAAANGAQLAGKVRDISLVPITEGQFTGRVDLAAKPELLPGMTCDVKAAVYKKAEAVVVPAKHVFTDELDDNKHYVYLVQPGKAPLKWSVTVGKKTDSDYEIVDGLKGGEKILKDKPE